MKKNFKAIKIYFIFFRFAILMFIKKIRLNKLNYLITLPFNIGGW